MSRQGFSRLLAALLLLVLVGCQAEVDVNLDVAHDGSGSVTVEANLDADVEATLGDLGERLRIADLERADWTITVVQSDDGSALVTATKPVSGPQQWQRVLDEIAGPNVFRDVEVRVVDDRRELSFDLDLSDGWSLFSDADVTEALGGELFGAPLDDLTGGRTIDEIITLDLNVSVRNFDDGVPTIANYSPRFDDGELVQVRVEATGENSTVALVRWIAIAFFCLGVLAAALATTGIVLQRRADRLRPAPTPASLASRVPRPATVAGVGASAGGASQRQGSPRRDPERQNTVRLVVMDVLAVMYAQSNEFDQNVLPFVRERGGAVRADTIAQGFRSVHAGSMDTAAFWELCGVDGDAAVLDQEYVQRRSLHRGAASFLAEMQRRRIPVAATTNDAGVWSTSTRERDRLSAVWPWLVSSEVGTSTSNAAMFEVLRRESSIAHAHCLYVDTDLAALDTARGLGMKTALFDTGDLELPAVVGHPVITDLKDLFGKK